MRGRKAIMTVILSIVAAACFVTTAAPETANLERLIINDGERVHVALVNRGELLTIEQGSAERVPRYPVNERERELDVSTLNFKIKARADSIEISGPSRLTLDGITKSFGGSAFAPALVIDKDSHSVLRGATTEIYVKVNPLARATIDSRNLHVKTIYVINNPDVEVTCRHETDVVLLRIDEPETVSVSGAGEPDRPQSPEAPQANEIGKEEPPK